MTVRIKHKKKHKDAWRHFYPEGNGKAKEGYCLHHKDPSLKERDPERYHEWNVEDLVMITMSEHSKLHQKGRIKSEEERRKMSEAKKGRDIRTEEWKQKMLEVNRGKKLTEEQKQKLLEAHKNHVLTDEQRKNMSIAQKQRFTRESELVKSGAKKVEQLTLEGNHIAFYPSANFCGERE